MPLWEALVLILSSINLNAQNISGDYFIEDGVFFDIFDMKQVNRASTGMSFSHNQEKMFT